MLSEDQVSGQVLDHLGLLVATMDKIGLVEKIDARLPLSKKMGAKVSMGQRVAAMILNGLGFMDDRLYMFPEFLENKPVQRFFGSTVEASHFNDDALGRCLDAIYDYGVTKLFAELAFSIGTQFGLLGKTARTDTTSLTLYGEYAKGEREGNENQEVDPFLIKRGYSKDGRHDLKQVVLNLTTTGSANLPIWMAAHSGNASDKVVLQQAAERMKTFSSALEEAPSFVFVGDSALYEKCAEKGGEMLWLSRVPHTNKPAKALLALREDEISWEELEKGYRISTSYHQDYKGTAQRWVLVFSQQMYERELATLEKKIAQEQDEITKEFWHLGNQQFSCAKDAQEAAKKIERKLQYHTSLWEIESITKHKGKGRPKKDCAPEVVGYRVAATLRRNEAAIALAQRKKGRFILATSQLEESALSNADMLYEYKQQIHTEAGFRFIKGNAFEVSGVFLKKSTRIQSLMMIMTLCLMVYNLAQYFLRQALQIHQDTIPNQLKKPINNPTMAWVCRLFHGVQVIHIRFDSYVQELVANLKEVLRRIIGYFGEQAEKIYGLSG